MKLSFALFLVFFLSGITHSAKAQLTLDSVKIYYGLTQKETTKPLNDYFVALENQGAKIQTVKKEYVERIKMFYASTKPKKYKKGKHQGTIYFLEGFNEGKKELLVFETTTEKGILINITTGQQYILEDKKYIDELYYLLMQIH